MSDRFGLKLLIMLILLSLGVVTFVPTTAMDAGLPLAK